MSLIAGADLNLDFGVDCSEEFSCNIPGIRLIFFRFLLIYDEMEEEQC